MIPKNLTEVFRRFISAENVEISEGAAPERQIILHAEWRFERKDLMSADNFTDLFSTCIEPLADLLRVSQQPVIDLLKKKNEDLEEEKRALLTINKSLENEYKTYRSAIRDSK